MSLDVCGLMHCSFMKTSHWPNPRSLEEYGREKSQSFLETSYVIGMVNVWLSHPIHYLSISPLSPIKLFDHIENCYHHYHRGTCHMYQETSETFMRLPKCYGILRSYQELRIFTSFQDPHETQPFWMLILTDFRSSERNLKMWRWVCGSYFCAKELPFMNSCSLAD